jgi:hypothetical protein
MYRVIIPGRFTIGDLRNSSVPKHFARKLIQQFGASQRCSEIILDESALEFAESNKAKALCKFESSGEFGDLKNVVIVYDRSHFKSVPLHNTESIVVLSAITQSKRISQDILSLSSLYPQTRISEFRYSRILSSDAAAADLVARPLVEKMKDVSYPILSQFLPARYREIDAKHLAQAVRLNFETCERMPTLISCFNPF